MSSDEEVAGSAAWDGTERRGRGDRRTAPGRLGGRRAEDRVVALRRPRAYTLLLLPDNGEAGRRLELSTSYLRLLAWSGWACLFLILAMGVTWAYLVSEAVRVAPLERRVAELTEESRRIDLLVRQLETIEASYDGLRGLFGTGAAHGVSEAWLPPRSGRLSSAPMLDRTNDARPTSWPLSDRGFITQPLVESDLGDHNGVDIAVPTGSYVRAAGSGRVFSVGTDAILGHFVILEHAEGFQSLYAHTSVVFVVEGDEVRRNEVIALSGSSGRSSAPHLHFEITLEGQWVDPLSMVQQP